MISLTKKSIFGFRHRGGSRRCLRIRRQRRACGPLSDRVGEGTFGPAGNIPYQNGIIRQYTTDPDGPLNIPQSAAFQYSPANSEINGIAGDYNVSAEASNVHGGTAHAYAFGDGGFSG